MGLFDPPPLFPPDKKVKEDITKCPCYHWTKLIEIEDIDKLGTKHHPACDGTGKRKYNQDFPKKEK